jgi:hypothetical protein
MNRMKCALAAMTASTTMMMTTPALAANPLVGALGETKPTIDFRTRYEGVDQLGIAEKAHAVTWRVRLGVQTGRAWNTALLAEFEAVDALQDDYRADPSQVGVNTTLPVIIDPSSHEINRLQLTNTSIANTTITLGRQRINLDDQRFVGNVGWRQNEQTLDALRVVNISIPKLTVDVTYATQANRIAGEESPQSPYRGDIYLANVGYQFPVGKLTGFGYLLGFDPMVFATGPGVTAALAAGLNPARASTSTYGVRFAGERPVSRIKLGYVLSYAEQQDYDQNPLAIDNDYMLLELSGTWRQYTLLLGDEVMSGDGVIGFSTPLATLHKFQGWVDKFLTTPANGIDDRYASFSWQKKGVGPLDTLALTATYHQYEPERISGNYGTEINLQLSAKYQRVTGMLKYGDYQAAASTPLTIARDTSKLWAQLEYAY